MQLRNLINCFAKTFLVTSTLSVSAYAGADTYNHIDNGHFDAHQCDNHCHYRCETPPPPGVVRDCCGEPCVPAPDCGWAYNPPAYPRCGCDTSCCDNTLTFRADFLWWRANEEGLQLGTEEFVDSYTNSGIPVRTAVINKSYSKKPDFKYDPGFRIGLSNYCPCECWDFAINWTHFHTKANVRGETADNVEFISDWERIIGANPLLSRGRYSLNLDCVDIEFGRKFYASNCFVLRPEFGLRLARLNQHYRIASEASVGGENVDPLESFTSNVKARSNFLAVGPRVGMGIELQLGCGLSLFGEAAGSILFGKFDNHSREIFTDYTTVSADEIGDFTYNEKSSAHRCSRTVSDLAIGFKWDHCYEWCGHSHPVSLAFAWEHHAFYDLNSFNFASRGFDIDAGIADNGVAKHGDLYTQGLTVSLSFGF